jgi:branched-chain amino acid transport system substrate-binding protein
VRRIAKSGATHVFVGGDAYDVSIMGQDAAAIGLDVTFAGGNAFLAPPADGTLPKGAVFAGLTDILSSTDGRYFSKLAKAASQIGVQALDYAKENETMMTRAMTAQPFETDLGLIRFGLDGENDRQWFSIFKISDGKPIPFEGNNG